jgi:hypothetical protein
MRKLRTLILRVTPIAALNYGASAQTAPQHTFEVASIKPAAPNSRFQGITFNPGGRMEVTDLSLKDLIAAAWRMQVFQISGGQPWLESARYDIVAKPETNPQPGEVDLMIRPFWKTGSNSVSIMK